MTGILANTTVPIPCGGSKREREAIQNREVAQIVRERERQPIQNHSYVTNTQHVRGLLVLTRFFL